jgi:hypothetical protein
MLLEQTNYWMKVEAYVLRPPSRWQLLTARAEWLWLQWLAGAEERREMRAIARLRDASRCLPEYLRRDIGLI